MYKTTCFIFGIVLLSVSGLSQVAVPAAILDTSGASIHGLQKQDFRVNPSKAASFDAVEEVPPLNFSGFGEPIPVFVLFDAASIPPPVQGQTAKKLLNYLRKAADEHLAVTVLINSEHGLELAHDMSTDARVFTSAMDRVMPGPKKGIKRFWFFGAVGRVLKGCGARSAATATPH